MFSKFFTTPASVTPEFEPSTLFNVQEEGIAYPRTLADEENHWGTVAYLEQLEEEGYVIPLSDRWLLPWVELHSLLGSEEHVTSLPVLNLPPVSPFRPVLASEGSLADSGFKLFIRHWVDPETGELVQFDRTGAAVHYNGETRLLSAPIWQLLLAIQALETAQAAQPGELTNQLGWSAIRKQARQAGVQMDAFLERSIVLRPENLVLDLRKSVQGDSPMIEVSPNFDGQPEGFLSSFDRQPTVQDRYRIVSPDGSITHVLMTPEVKTVLEAVKTMPGRRVAGDAALSLIRNPYSFLGDAAVKVLEEDAHAKALKHAGIYFHHFTVEPVLDERREHIHHILLILEAQTADPEPPVTLSFNAPYEFAGFVQELRLKFAAGMPAGFWQGYELELGTLTEAGLNGIQALLSRWENEVAGVEFESVLDLSLYGDRVKGIGEAEVISSPFLMKDKSEDWLPSDFEKYGIDPDVLQHWDSGNRENFETFEQNVTVAKETGAPSVELPGLGIDLPLQLAERLLEAWRHKLEKPEHGEGDKPPAPPRTVLQIESNIEETTYEQQRRAELGKAHHASAQLPDSLRSNVTLRQHQLEGVAWLQHLFMLSPDHVTGALLADDMGLGKTIQLLTFIVHFLETEQNCDPVLIVAPVSLLDNWEQELNRFFYTSQLSVLKLYGTALSATKFKAAEIPADLRAKGIRNLLRPGWRGDARIVLTTYETLRDQEFSLARQRWSIMVCDEAQKIKNPTAQVTQAAKTIPARFRVACTGTPVENTLIDMWCLFDFIQPGHLGALNHFGRNFQRPIEAEEERDQAALEQLRALIDPQTLRRTKQDVAKDLPAKYEDEDCRRLIMHPAQRELYLSEIGQYAQRKQLQDELEDKSSGVLGLLHRLKLVCAYPYSVKPEPVLREKAPKVDWLIKTLKGIHAKGEKVIIFTELRDIQRELQHVIYEHFDVKPTIINGDTSTSSKNANSRQKLIDQFQASPGFNVIILSTIAVGFGVNVQAANHVIHFTRCWNPAKEDQATDRAYRIGQEKDVYVYYPTVRDASLHTFEATLDDLLARRRLLARDMLVASGDIQASEFAEVLAS